MLRSQEKIEAYEKKITSTSISVVRTPRQEDSWRAAREMEAGFCRDYANIQIDQEAKFADRMQFDIYKRATKEQRMVMLAEMSKLKMSKQEQERLYDRLIDDGKRWNQKKRQLETYSENETSQVPSEARKLTKRESDMMYERMMKQQQEKELDIIRKRALVQTQQKLEEEELMGQPKQRSIHLGENLNSDDCGRAQRDVGKISGGCYAADQVARVHGKDEGEDAGGAAQGLLPSQN